jgi:hypothetical protein
MPENTPPDGAPLDPFAVDRLLADPDTARDAAEQDLATLFAALRAPAEPHELAREREHLAAFAAARALGPLATTTRRSSVLTSFLATKTAVAAAAVAAVTAAGAAGAYTGSLPDRLQNVAHDTLGAPAGNAKSQRPDKTPKPDPSPSRSNRDGSVDATGSAAHGLCTAFAAGGLATTSTAYGSLAEAAGGASRIEAYCAAVPAPGEPSTGPTTKPNGKPIVKPTDHPTGAPADRGKPTDLRKGKPDDLRTGKPTDRPGH